MSENSGIRINKYLSEIGHCSRRAADKLIEQGRVRINGKVPAIGTKVTGRDKVTVDGALVSEPEAPPVYLAFNKPIGIVCTTDKSEPDNIINYVNYPTRIFPIGRLDKASEGLIFLTSDGDIVNKILRADNSHQKEYEVSVNKPITDDFIEKMGNGVPIMGSMTRKCKVEKTSTFSFRIVLTQGLNRQIRRMCEHFDYEVQKLKRVRIMNVELDLPVGQWRDLTPQELLQLRMLVSSSSKTAKTKSGGSPKSSKPAKPKSPGKPKSRAGKGPGKPFAKKNAKSGSRKKSGKPGRSGGKPKGASGKGRRGSR